MILQGPKAHRVWEMFVAFVSFLIHSNPTIGQTDFAPNMLTMLFIDNMFTVMCTYGFNVFTYLQ